MLLNNNPLLSYLPNTNIGILDNLSILHSFLKHEYLKHSLQSNPSNMEVVSILLYCISKDSKVNIVLCRKLSGKYKQISKIYSKFYFVEEQVWHSLFVSLKLENFSYINELFNLS